MEHNVKEALCVAIVEIFKTLPRDKQIEVASEVTTIALCHNSIKQRKKTPAPRINPCVACHDGRIDF